MSRCFPFPPPGYEKKATPDDVNLIIKEKNKQKKHKDKKDKYKKEKSERKVKERSEGKDKKDKDRKEKKHRDKKEKEEKRKLLEEKNTEGSSEDQNAEKLCTVSKPNDQIHDSKILAELGKRVRDYSGATGSQTVQKKIFLEEKNGLVGNLSRESPNKVKNGSHQVLAGSHMVQKNIPVGQKNGLVGTFSRENPNKVEVVSRPVHAGNHMVQENAIVGQKNGLVGNKVECGPRQVRGDNQMVQKNILVGQKNGLVGNFYGENPNKVDSGPLQDSRMVQKNILVGHTDGLVGNIPGENQSKVEGGSRQAGDVEKGKEGKKEKKKRKSSDGKGDGHKNKDRDKKAEEKKRKKEKKKKKEEIKRRENGGNFPDFCENKPLELLKESHESQGNSPKHKELLLNGFVHDHGIQPNNMSRPASSSQIGQNGSGFDPSHLAVVEKGGVITNHKVKGKVSSSHSDITIVMNMEPGLSASTLTAEHGREKVDVITNHKVKGKVSSSQSFAKNVMNMEPNGSSSIFTAEHVGPVISNHSVSNGPISPHQTTSNVAKPINNLKVPSPNPVMENGRKTLQPVIHKAAECRGPVTKNSVIEDKPCTSSRASCASVKAEKKVDTYKNPPHPDSKYLSQIYSVPPQVDWPQFDDHDWLFGCEDPRTKRAKLSLSEIEPPNQVWSEAMQVESADVIALPYVVPY